jgi:hypothetical protein
MARLPCGCMDICHKRCIYDEILDIVTISIKGTYTLSNFCVASVSINRAGRSGYSKNSDRVIWVLKITTQFRSRKNITR